ncbi:peptidoglycan-binding protein [Caryophanon tenue]|uniref:Peptidoglycan-binding protein n=2 Tax=Caryophanon tenue TaxID=33978 RepID=A0A1C0Y8S2_9BACL|nr:peptidoglycan-binding protein [Caryophanon tenue]
MEEKKIMKKKAFLTAAVMALGLGFASNDASAAEHKVRSGETLWLISQNYNTSVNALKASNGLGSDMIYAGQTLQVGGSTKASTAQSAAEGKYTVKSGDTLASIAAAYGTSVQTLVDWNGLRSAHVIYAGDVLTVKNGSVRAPIETAKRNAQAKAASSQPAQQTSRSAVQTMTVEATAYTAYCTGCSGTTANGTDLRANPGAKVIAVDPNVIPLGTRVWVEGYGEAIAADTGGAIKGNRIDVFIPSQDGAMDWGRRTVTLKILN